MTYFSGSVTFGIIIASLIGSFIADKIPMMFYNLLPIGFLLVLLVYITLRIRQLNPVQMKQMCTEKTKAKSYEGCPMANHKQTTTDIAQSYDNLVSPGAETKKSFFEAFPYLITNVVSLLVGAFTTYKKPRKGHRRIILILCTLTSAAYVACALQMHSSVIAMFAYRRPLSWTPRQLAQWRFVVAIIDLFGTVIGVNIFKRILKLHETTIILISLTSLIAEAVIISFANTTWIMYLAAGAASFAFLGLPSFKALTTRMVESDEVGKVLSISGTAQSLGIFLAMAMLNNIYAATVSHTPGAVFYMIGGLFTVYMIIMAGVHFMYKRDLAMEKKEVATIDVEGDEELNVMQL